MPVCPQGVIGRAQRAAATQHVVRNSRLNGADHDRDVAVGLLLSLDADAGIVHDVDVDRWLAIAAGVQAGGQARQTRHAHRTTARKAAVHSLEIAKSPSRNS